MRTEREIEAACDAFREEVPEVSINVWNDDMRRGMKAALAAADAEAWRPISEAPKDGTPLLLYPTFAHMFDVAMGYWHHEHDCWYMVNLGHLNGLWEPTHFRHLPEPPR